MLLHAKKFTDVAGEITLKRRMGGNLRRAPLEFSNKLSSRLDFEEFRRVITPASPAIEETESLFQSAPTWEIDQIMGRKQELELEISTLASRIEVARDRGA
jgi:hypothetical protein